LANKTFTLIVVPDHNSQVKRYRIQKRYLFQVGAAAMILVGLATAATVHYFSVAKDASENRILREENLALKGQLKSIRERIDHIGTTLDRVERFDQKLRAITLLSDPQRNLAMGPTETEPGSTVPVDDLREPQGALLATRQTVG
jgi:hypothetical protein